MPTEAPTLLQAMARSRVHALRPYRRQRVPGTVNLASNELRHPVLERLAAEALATADGAEVAGYPSYAPFLDRLADHLGVTADSLLLVAGSDDAYRLLVDALTVDPDRPPTVVTQQLNYQSLADYAQLRGLDVVSAAYQPWHGFDVEELIAVQAARPGRATVWVSDPNGPTGAAFRPAELDRLAAEVGASGNLLVVDEVYRDFHQGPRWPCPPAPGSQDHVIRIRSFSKGYGLAGARLGYVHAHPDVIDYLARWNSAGPVSTPALRLAAHLLGATGELAAVHREVIADRTWFAAAADRLPGLSALPSQGNFVPLRADGDRLVDRCLHALDRAGIRVRDLRPLRAMGPVLRVGMAGREVLGRVLTALETATGKA